MSDEHDIQFPLLKKWFFLQAVFADEELSSTAKVVAGRLLFHLNAKNGLCIPSYDKLAKGAGCSRRAAIEAVKQLESGGWISFNRRSNESSATSHSFKMHFDKIAIDDDSEGTSDSENPSPPSAEISPPSENPSPPLVQKLHHPWCNYFTRGSENSAPEHREYINRESEHRESETGNLRLPPARSTGRKNAEIKAAFEIFWAAYPEKVGKGAAEKAFGIIFKSSEMTLDHLIEGLDRYKKSKPSDRAWCYPATWLNQKRWLDEPAPRSISHPNGQASSRLEMALRNEGLR